MAINPTDGISQAGDAVISIGTSLSAEIILGGNVFVGLYMPATWTAAAITYSVSFDGATFHDMFKDGSEYTTSAGAGQYIPIAYQDFMGVRRIRLRSGTSGAPVNQGGERSIQMVAGRPS